MDQAPWGARFGGLASLLLASCGAGGIETGGDPADQDPGTPLQDELDPASHPANPEDQFRFLSRATFGPNEADFTRLGQIGYGAWLDEQLALPGTHHRPPLEALQSATGSLIPIHRQDVWWSVAVTSPDQLRQRVAFAWSELFVISDDDPALFQNVLGVADYYDVLVDGAFSNYRDLLEDVARSPAMGVYLSMHKNVPSEPGSNLHPDENFAREIMQLFSIGLVQLAPDGSVLASPGGDPASTYEQEDVEEIARAFTGWNFAGATNWENPEPSFEPMEHWSEYHDQNGKSVLDGTVLPAGQSGQEDLDQILDALFEHPNVGPFVANHLIRRLVTSNPSPGYVQRVAQVFADDGTGERGDLGEVVRAVLLDDEAFGGLDLNPTSYGKLREPLLRVTALWRAFDGVPPEGVYTLGQAELFLGQAPLSAPTVFNFFQPHHAPPGPVSQAGLVAPELQLADEVRMPLSTNMLRKLVYQGHADTPVTGDDQVWMDFSDELELAATPPALIDHLDLLLLGGTMSTPMRTALIEYLGEVSMTFGGLEPGLQRVLEAVFLILISPEGAMQP